MKPLTRLPPCAGALDFFWGGVPGKWREIAGNRGQGTKTVQQCFVSRVSCLVIRDPKTLTGGRAAAPGGIAEKPCLVFRNS